MFQPHAPADTVRVPPQTASATAHIANFFFEALLIAIYFLLKLSDYFSFSYQRAFEALSAKPVIKLQPTERTGVGRVFDSINAAIGDGVRNGEQHL